MLKAIMKLDGKVISEKDVLVEAAKATKVDVTVASSTVASGAVLSAEFLQGSTSLLSGQTKLP
jgi:hypothetical protein